MGFGRLSAQIRFDFVGFFRTRQKSEFARK
jgi:hypothetical protein